MASPSLSASRLKDFHQCPLLYRLRVIDRIPEPPSVAAIKGTCVHAALEAMFDLPAPERTHSAVCRLFDEVWAKWRADNPEGLAQLGLDSVAAQEFTTSAHDLIGNYFRLELPERLQPTGREQFVRARSRDGLALAGIIDRIDEGPAGVRIVDYKSGKSPHPSYVSDPMFQMRFYALLYHLTTGKLPQRLQLLFLRDAKTLVLDPTVADLELINKQVNDLWDELKACVMAGTFPAQTSRLCDWCNFHAQCPTKGGVTPPLDRASAAALLEIESPTPKV